MSFQIEFNFILKSCPFSTDLAHLTPNFAAADCENAPSQTRSSLKWKKNNHNFKTQKARGIEEEHSICFDERQISYVCASNSDEELMYEETNESLTESTSRLW